MDSVTITPFHVGNNIRIKWKQLPITTQRVITVKLGYKVILELRVDIGMFASTYITDFTTCFTDYILRVLMRNL